MLLDWSAGDTLSLVPKKHNTLEKKVILASSWYNGVKFMLLPNGRIHRGCGQGVMTPPPLENQVGL